MNKIIKILRSALLFAFVIALSTNIVSKSVVAAYSASNPEEIIREYFSCMGHDWNGLADLYPDDEKEGVRQFLLNEDFAANNVGILNVTNAEVTDIVEVDYQNVKDYFTNEYDESSVRTFVVGADYSVKKDSMFFSNGLVYNVILLIQELDGLKIKEFQQIAYPKQLLEEGYEFADEYENTIEMMNARLDGVLINGDGEIFDTIGEQVEIKNTNSVALASVASRTTYAKTTYNIPTADTMVCVGRVISGVPYYLNSSGVESPKYAEIPFFDYCLGVTAGEAEYTYLNGEPRKAIVVAIKTFTWHHMIINENNNPVYGILMKSDLHKYNPSRINAKIREDFNLVKNVWMESEEGYIFEAYYSKGKENYVKQHLGKSEGRLYQDGCRYLYEDYKMNYKNMLRYYYNDSIINKGEGLRECHVGTIRFFDSNKKCFK